MWMPPCAKFLQFILKTLRPGTCPHQGEHSAGSVCSTYAIKLNKISIHIQNILNNPITHCAHTQNVARYVLTASFKNLLVLRSWAWQRGRTWGEVMNCADWGGPKQKRGGGFWLELGLRPPSGARWRRGRWRPVVGSKNIDWMLQNSVCNNNNNNKVHEILPQN